MGGVITTRGEQEQSSGEQEEDEIEGISFPPSSLLLIPVIEFIYLCFHRE